MIPKLDTRRGHGGEARGLILAQTIPDCQYKTRKVTNR